jgi:hypothetical protein
LQGDTNTALLLVLLIAFSFFLSLRLFVYDCGWVLSRNCFGREEKEALEEKKQAATGSLKLPFCDPHLCAFSFEEDNKCL